MTDAPRFYNDTDHRQCSAVDEQGLDCAAPESHDGPHANVNGEWSTCGWCRRSGHLEAEHPLPKDHPQYDAFYDATDDELGTMVSDVLRRQGWTR